LGYGDLLLIPSWRLLGPLEAANGALMFGVSTAMVFAIIQRLLLAKFEDLGKVLSVLSRRSPIARDTDTDR
jgi:hypothetical protein